MKFGVREITDVVFKATSADQKLGSVTYGQYDPILFFDSAKTATLESTVATVYAQGGRGNPRLLAWDGDKVVTFTFEDALMSRASFAALAGSGLVNGQTLQIHLTEKATAVVAGNSATITIDNINGNLTNTSSTFVKILNLDSQGDIVSIVPSSVSLLVTKANTTVSSVTITASTASISSSVIVDFYVGQTGTRNTIDAGSFAGYYYIEANTLFRGTDGKDYPAQFTIPKGKVQSNFTFTMAPTGDPSTFTFTIDALPAPTRFDSTKDVLFTLEVSDSSTDII
jgi:hypothetical protein